ncbi:MAG: hypothetical protein SFY80_01460 [Verrucomicrobiota bacterium]|nr:hypothetical protein [Verrucomicrobiota bacterium]
MLEESLAELDPRLQKQAASARQAFDQGNPDYSVAVCLHILKGHPGCVEVRQCLHDAYALKRHVRHPLARVVATVFRWFYAFQVRANLTGNPLKALELAEKFVAISPASVTGHWLLGQAATAADLPKTAVFAFEEARRCDPSNGETLLALGTAYLVAGQNLNAVNTAEALLRLSPANAAAVHLRKKASVAQSIQQGNLVRTERTG